MKSKTFLLSLLIVLLFTAFQNSHSQTFTSVRYNTDSILFDGSNVNINYHSGCAGRVSAIKGCAKIIKPGGECGMQPNISDASVGSNVEEGDRIQVCSKSFVDVTMPDGSVIRGAPGSEINIDAASCENQSSFSLRLFLGSVWSEVAPYVGGETKYEVKTENAVTGVRGTKYFIKVGYDTVYSNPEKTVWEVNVTTTVIVLEGVVEVGNSNGATLADTASQLRLFEDFENKRITLEEFQRRATEMQNNNKILVEAGMETTVYAGNPPTLPRRTRMTLEDFSQENIK